MQFNTTAAFDKAVAGLLDADHTTLTTDGPLKGAKLMLGSGSPVLGKDSAVADITEAVYSGYAKSAALTWSVPFREADGSYSKTSDRKLFQSGTAGTYVPDTITVVALISSDVTPVLYGWGILDTAVSFSVPDVGVNLTVTLNQGALSVHTEVIVDD